MKKSGLIFLFSFTIFLILTSSAHAIPGTYYYVDGVNGSDSNNGTDTAHPFKTINSAEAASWGGSTIEVRTGVYNLPATISVKNGNLKGGYDASWNQTGTPGATVIDGGGTIQCMTGIGLSGSATIEDFTIQNGYSSGTGGGGLYLSGGTPTIKNCIFRSNSTTTYGGGIYAITSSYPILRNCEFISNTANTGGGGVAFSNDSTGPTISNCTFISNGTSGFGGGIFMNKTSPTIINSIIYYQASGSSMYIASVSSPVVQYSCVQGGNDQGGWNVTSTNNISTEPQFINVSAGDVHLYTNSPCVNAGSTSASSLGLDYTKGFGTHPNLAYGDDGTVDMGFHYLGYTGSELTIPDSTPPSVSIISPATGNSLGAGTSYNISWSASDASGLIGPVTIYYSTNEGLVYTKVATCDSGVTNCSWQVPNVITNEARIKVSVSDTYYNLGVGESGDFSIRHLQRAGTVPLTPHIDRSIPQRPLR